MQYFATVLLVGHGDALDQAERWLEHPQCFETVRVNTIEAGLDLLSRFLFDVVIVGGPWSELFHMIVGIRNRAPQVPILGLPPGDVGPELIDRLLELGADRYISPSTSGSSLRAAVLATCACDQISVGSPAPLPRDEGGSMPCPRGTDKNLQRPSVRTTMISGCSGNSPRRS